MLLHSFLIAVFLVSLVILLNAAVVTPTATAITDLTALIATTPWVAMKAHLSINDFVPSQNNILTDYSSGECTFTGYAAQSVTFGTPFIDTNGNVVANALVNFACTGGTTLQNAYTIYITNTAGTVLQFGAVLDNAPVAFAGSGYGVSILISVQLSGGTIAVVG